MAIDMKARRAQLLEREKELTHGALDESSAGEVMDGTDAAVADEERDAELSEDSRDFEALREVREALARIDAGTYGKCTVCGREIEAARLDAVPATRYCIDDARARDPKVRPATL